MILTVINFCVNDSAQADQLLEFIFAQNGRKQLPGHILLAHTADIDKEMLARIKISAELAFAGVHTFEVKPLADKVAPKWKCCNSAFKQVANHIAKEFREAFLWLEPDAIPTKAGWLEKLDSTYNAQPKHYLGNRMKMVQQGKDLFFMARSGIYPNNAATDYQELEMPFEIAIANRVMPKMTVEKMFQQLVIQHGNDLINVRADALMVHGDKQGIFLREIEASFPKEEKFEVPIIESIKPVVNPPEVKKRGRPSKAEMAAKVEAIASQLNVKV